MFIAITLFIIIFICISFSFIEERFQQRDKILLYAFIGMIMIFIAGSRSIYDTPDSDNYESMYYSVRSLDNNLREPTFTFMSYCLNTAGFGINALFFAYAILSIPIRLCAIWKMSKLPFLTLGVYISFYYQLHDLIQMRCAVASALFLLSIYYRIEKKLYLSIGCILVGTLFHYSALAGLVIFFFGNKELSTFQCWILYLIVPLGLVFFFAGLDISHLLPDELGGNRLEAYRKLKDKGLEDDFDSWIFYKNPIILANICLYYGCIYYHEILTRFYKYTPIMLKIMAFAFICMLTLGNISSVLASRLNEYFEIVSIFLWTATIYAFYPILYGKILVNSISFVRCLASVFIYALGILINNR